MWIKICANTSLEDARLAAELGADAVGFVFAPSPRQVTAAQVAEIAPKLPKSLEKIGVFSSTDADEIIEIVRKAGRTGVQLHGGFDLRLVRRLDAEFAGEIAIIPVLHWVLGQDEASAAQIRVMQEEIAAEPAIDRVLLDAKAGSVSGGTGLAFDWISAREALAGQSRLRVIAAGGLNPGNVARAIEQMTPWGVDVASGVEAAKGRKDPGKLKEFIETVRGSREKR
jgi:phosphoribosylanthranilate isomerase